ncbi:hypothetical protein ES708_25690 [subsurface metagenome]
MLGGAGARREGGQGGRDRAPGASIRGAAASRSRSQGSQCTLFEGQTHPRQGFRVQVASTWALLAVQVAGGGAAGRGQLVFDGQRSIGARFQPEISTASGRGDHRSLEGGASRSKDKIRSCGHGHTASPPSHSTRIW